MLGEARARHYADVLTRLAKPYRVTGGKIVQSEETNRGIGTANGVVTTVLDLAKFERRDRPAQARLRRDAGTDVDERPHDNGRPIPYGLGWFVQNIGGTRVVWHNGYLPDRYSALYVKVPEKRLTLIVLANSDALSASFQLAKGDVTRSPIARAFLSDFGLLVAQRVDRIEPRGFPRGIEAEEDPDDRGDAERRATTDDGVTTIGHCRKLPDQRPRRRRRARCRSRRRRSTSVTASNRNCSRTWRPFAPMAMRMPISRVRSVTETSMMFMMPMPPTSSEIAAIDEQERAQDAASAASCACAISSCERIMKSASPPGGMRWRWREDGVDLVLRFLHLVGGGGGDLDHVDLRLARRGASSPWCRGR